MSSERSSPLNGGGYEAAAADEPARRLTVRKDLFPEVRLSKLDSLETNNRKEIDQVSCVKLETDFEQSIDEIQKLQNFNGVLPASEKSRHKKHKQSRRESKRSSTPNGCLPSEMKRKKKSPRESRSHRTHTYSIVPSKVKGGKNLNLVSSSEGQDSEHVEDEEEDDEEEVEEVEEASSEDEVLKYSVKLPIYSVSRQTGKPYSHELSQLSSKKSKSKDSKERKTYSVTPCSGKPRSMLDICSSHSKKKKKAERTSTYQSLIVDTNTNLKIKIRRTSFHEVVAPTPASIADIGQRKSKKKRAATPSASESSGEEYDPSRGDTAASMTVSAPKPRHPPSKAKKPATRNKGKNQKTEKVSRVSGAGSKEAGPQSPWAERMPEEVLVKIFDYVVQAQGTLPAVIRLGRVCKLWHSVSCRPQLWRNVDLSQYSAEKCRTDYKLVWLLENRLSQCHTLNIAQWKVSNTGWVLACLADYCPQLQEVSVAGWSRLSPDHLHDLFHALPRLSRIDLSQTSESGGSGTCLSAASVARLVEGCGARITHLTLANNMFTALQQILTSIAAHCPNLEVLDISGARATSHPALVPLEALQKGCPNVRVFRAANAQLVLANATTSQQMEAGGWRQLEELSIAGAPASERVSVGQYSLADEALDRLVRGATRLRLLDVRALQRLSDSGLVRVPAWDLQHLFLGGCNVLRQKNACLELICEKWSHSLLELDLSWASAERALDDAVSALADAQDSKLRVLNLCGSSVSLAVVKKVLLRCRNIESLNLSSCRGLPRGMKRLLHGHELHELRDSFDPHKLKAKEDERKKKEEEAAPDSKPDTSPKHDATDTKAITKPDDKTVFQEPRSVPSDLPKQTDLNKISPDRKSVESLGKESESLRSPSTPKMLSPIVQPKPDSSSTPRSDTSKADSGSPRFSPASKPDSQVQNSPEVPPESLKSSSWNLGQFKTTPTHKSEASPLNKYDSHTKMKPNKTIEQCSPTTSQDNRPSPDTHPTVKQDMKTPNSYYGGYSPLTRQEFASQRSPYSAQPSPAQPSPYSAQPSPYSTQPSPYSSQPSPYSAQPSPDTSQIVKQDLNKSSGAWSTGNYSPMTKHPAPFSPHAATLPSPEPGLAGKPAAGRTPGQYSPMSRQDRRNQSPYSPRDNKKSPGVSGGGGGYSPLMRPDCHLASPETLSTRRPDAYRQMSAGKRSDPAPPSEMAANWGHERYNQLSASASATASIESLVWGSGGFGSEPAPQLPPHHQQWPALPSFDAAASRQPDDTDPWTLGQFRLEPPHNNFVEQNVAFESLTAHLQRQPHLAAYLEESLSESRVD